MPKELSIKGWKPAAAPKRGVSYPPDVVGQSYRVLRSDHGKAKVDSVPTSRRTRSKLRGVYLRPENGTDADAKLFIVDEQNRPVYVQG